MSMLRDSVIGENIEGEEPLHKENVMLDLISSTFYTVIGYC